MTTIDGEMRERIMGELAAIEVEHRVKVMLAVESGSRAWGFPSPDSDYDVRFIYVRPVEDYLTLDGRRDVIERPIDTVLDISGWDIRKALQLLLRSNAVLLEWLSSPLRYLATGPVPRQILDCFHDTANLAALDYHYDHLTRRSFGEIAGGDEQAGLETYCYAIRAALALCWLRDLSTTPPMDLPSLLSGVDLPSDLIMEIDSIIDRKAVAAEREVTPRIGVIDNFIERVLSKPLASARAVDRSAFRARADTLFAEIVLGRTLAPRTGWS